MQSVRRPELIYSDISTSVLDHDDDYDSELIYIGNDKVYKGAIDPRYTEYGLDVQWLYDEKSERVGLVEQETLNRDVYEVLWYYNNPYATFFQERGWKTAGKTIFSHLSNEAYVDCLEDEFNHLVEMSLGGSMRIITPSMIPNIPMHYYECSDCGKRTLSATNICKSLKKIDFSVSSSILFLDDSYVIYTPPDHSKIWKFTQRPPQHDDGVQSRAQEQEQEQEQELEPHPDQELQHPEQYQKTESDHCLQSE
jgi:hypothetical protein